MVIRVEVGECECFAADNGHTVMFTPVMVTTVTLLTVSARACHMLTA
jgi:hypothetical protein